jgi:hypothetical protein
MFVHVLNEHIQFRLACQGAMRFFLLQDGGIASFPPPARHPRLLRSAEIKHAFFLRCGSDWRWLPGFRNRLPLRACIEKMTLTSGPPHRAIFLPLPPFQDIIASMKGLLNFLPPDRTSKGASMTRSPVSCAYRRSTANG